MENPGTAGNATPEELHLYSRQLSKGSKGGDVEELQTYLLQLGYSVGSSGVDGDFGESTYLAVCSFQRDHGLAVDGIFGAGSWATMEPLIIDTEKPVVSNVRYTDLSPDGYTVLCDVSDNKGVVRVAFPTRAETAGETDYLWRDGTLSGNTASFRVSTSDHGANYGYYRTEVYAYDAAGNCSAYTDSIILSLEVPYKPAKPSASVSSSDDLHETVFSWGATQHTEYYDIRIYHAGEDTEFYGYMRYYPTSFSALLPAGEYKMNVASVNGYYGTWTFSDDVSFTVSGAATGGAGNLVDEETLNGHTYQLYDKNCTWLEAKRLAEQLGGHLMTINSQAEQDLAVELSRRNALYYNWIGAECFTGHGTWQWITGETMDYTYWSEGQPDNCDGDENVAFLWDYYKWNDTSNTNTYMQGYIVEYDAAEMTGGYGGVLPDGDYVIVNLCDTNYQLDIKGNDEPEDHTRVQLYERLGLDHNAFTISYNPSTKFYIIRQYAYNHNKSLSVVDDSLRERASVEVRANENGSKSQLWSISLYDRGTDYSGYRVQSARNGFYLDVVGGVMANRSDIMLRTADGTSQQGWLFVPFKPSQPLANGRYILVSALDEDIELDVAGDSGDIDSGTNVDIWNHSSARFYENALSQYNSFDVTALSDGYYRLTHAASGHALTVSGGSTASGANVVVASGAGDPSQAWAITPDGDNGGYVLRAQCSGYALDVTVSGTENGTNVQQCRYNGTKAQTWRFVPAEYTVHYDANGGTQAPGDQVKYYKGRLVLSAQQPSRRGYDFIGWATSATATGAAYQPGDEYPEDADITLYAVWEKRISLTLPAGLLEIEEEAFMNSGAQIVFIPDGCEEIGARAFADCANLREIHIPESVVTINRTAFNGCPDDLTICGASGSVAESFAQAKGYTFVADD